MTTDRKTVLLVDDDVDFLELNRHVLEAQGYRVLCATDPDEALALMTEQKPQLVITDLMMKSLDSGFLFSRRIKDDLRFTDVPVIILTAVGSKMGLDFAPRTPDDLAAMRADAFLEKPINPKALVEKVQELLGRCTREDSA
jgi:CheY-like chemotaxis protein